MPFRYRRSAVLLAALAATPGLSGCSQKVESGDPAAPEAARPAPPGRDIVPVVLANTDTAAPRPQPKPDTPTPAPAEPPATPKTATTEFAFPPDLAGRVLPRAVAPAAPAEPAVVRLGQTPCPRTPPAALLAPEPPLRVSYSPRPVLPKKSAGFRPVPPAERVPATLGVGAEAVPQKPALPDAPGLNIPAPNVNTPPPLPMLARPLPDRASLDDPTTEHGNAVIANRSEVPELGTAWFLKVGLPDPFELAGQVAPKVPPAAEPALTPVPVNPQRPK